MLTVTDQDTGYRDLMKRLGGAQSVSVLVGVRSSGGTELEVSDEGIVSERPDLADIARWNEFGTAHIPERSFLRATIDLNRAKYLRMLQDAVGAMIDGMPPLMAYGRIGMVAVGDVQRRIVQRIPPPNAPSTIAKKGSDVPLIDTGRLRQSVDYTVEFG